MAVTILMGSGQHDFRQAMLQNVQEKLMRNPNLSVYYLVPNHIKFASEVDVLERFARLNRMPKDQVYAQSRLQVYSLTRLAWHLLQQSSKIQPNIMQEAGLYMVVANILKQKASKLPVFARMQAKRGFIEALVAQLVELRSSQVQAKELLTVLDNLDQANPDLTGLKVNFSQKLRDLALVADEFDAVLDQNWITKAETLNFFAEELPHLSLTNSVFYFDSFNGFTGPEWAVLQQLLKRADITIALLGDRDALQPTMDGAVFQKPLQSAQVLLDLAQQNGIPTEIKPVTAKRSLSQDMQALLKAWESLGQYQSIEQAAPLDQVQFFKAENVVTELNEVARRIRQSLLKNPDLHLRDILIVARDLGPYTNHIPAVMQAFELPYFLDNDVKMLNHPLVELITNLLRPQSQRFYYQNLLALLKTGFLRPIQNGHLLDDQQYFEIVAFLDNYVTAHQPSAKIWHAYDRPFVLFESQDDQLSPVDQKINQRMNILRRFIGDALDKFEQGLDQAQTLQEAATFLVNWLYDQQVDQAILQVRDQLVDQGELLKGQQVEEVWAMFTQTLDQMVQVAGQQPYELDDFREALLAGFSGARFAGIPNQLDQLTISEAGIVQNQQYQELYFIGGSRQNLPAQVKNQALINDAERLLVQPVLSQQEQPRYLQDTAQQQMASENLLFYGALMASQMAVTFSYSILDENGQLTECSPYYQRLISHFAAPVTLVKAHAMNGSTLLKNYVGSARATLSQLAQLPASQQESSAFQALYGLLKKQPNLPNLDRVLSANQYQNQVAPLQTDLAQALFKQPLAVSISQLEAYYRDPFEYFLRYGLRLQERPSHDLDVAQTGTLYHAILEMVVRHLIGQEASLKDVDLVTIQNLVAEALNFQLTQPTFEFLQEANQGLAIGQYIAKVAQQLLGQLKQAASYNQSRPSAVEALFGFPKGALQGLRLADQGQQIMVRGKIDRFDRQDPQGQFGTIIDYKSSSKKFEWGQAYDGLQMQLLTYWQAAQNNAQALNVSEIGGAFFAQIAPSKTKLTDFKGDLVAMLAGELPSPDFKYHGLMLSDEAYLDNLEVLAPGEQAIYYQLKKRKDDQLTAASETVSAAELDLLLARNQENILRAGHQIQAGVFPILPVKGSLAYSPYQDIVRFDRILGDRYRPVSPNKKADILERLQGEEDA
ncbi:PD-(D/E)XK nuclease family protein [Convivina praedatoris]|uniref:PD-(D/E)XK nuclease family protein n=1 Tax=Convivina praedatoris TaxID=2880963 RepID=UPI00200E34D4|nr:PD-(D/E)XK nuclease family protein [Convivina sp. LMG 32447]CAH1850752.1 ATP-dependent helicase/deoxyribonuclease subunit B [Convivina sp. LMG 32447]